MILNKMQESKKQFKAKLGLEGLKIQTLIEACVFAYLDGDEHIKRLALTHQQLNTVNKKKVGWSKREQSAYLDAIEDVVRSTEENS